MEKLGQEIQRLVEEAGGTWAVVLKDLDSQETWCLNENQLFTAASVIKLPILAAVFADAAEGKLNLGDMLPLRREDQVGGSGILQHMIPGVELPIFDYLTLMIIQSDNTATNVMIDQVGIEKVQQTMQELGMSDSVFYNKLMIVPTRTPAKNQITASDVAGCLKQFVTGQFVSEYACEQMIAILKKQQVQNGLPAYLPDDDSDLIGVPPAWEVASKSGWVTGIHHDAGIFYVNGRTMVACALTKDAGTYRAPETLGRIGKKVYDYMKGTKRQVHCPTS